jgi:hypothetical protein
MYEILLDGRKEKNMKEFVFTMSRPREPMSAKGPTWWEIWDLVKNDSTVRQWRKDYPGQLPWAEDCYKRHKKPIP